MGSTLDEIKAKHILVNKETETLTIEWGDGHRSDYPFALLRNACPCAECRGGHEHMTSEPQEDMFTIPLMDARSTRLRAVEQVGNYALRIDWEDGHRFGIYDWRYLRALCPCSQCRPNGSIA